MTVKGACRPVWPMPKDDLAETQVIGGEAPVPPSPLPALVFPGPLWWLKRPESPLRPLGSDLLLSLTPHLPKPEGGGQILCSLSAPTAQDQLLISQHTPPWMPPEAQMPACPLLPLHPAGLQEFTRLLLSRSPFPQRMGQEETPAGEHRVCQDLI